LLSTHVSILCYVFFLMTRPPPCSTLFPYTTLFRSGPLAVGQHVRVRGGDLPVLGGRLPVRGVPLQGPLPGHLRAAPGGAAARHQIGRATSELQSRENLVCRLLLEKKKKKTA